MTTNTKTPYVAISYKNADAPHDIQLHRTPYEPEEGRIVWLVTQPDDLTRMPMTALLAVYNRAANKSIKGFNSRPKGVVQTYAALQQWLSATPAIEPSPAPSPDAAVPSPEAPTSMAPKTKTAPKKTVTPKKTDRALSLVKGAKTPADKKKPIGRRSKFAEDAVITVLAKENPKRPGSAAHARFAFYKTGQTVKQFLEKGGWRADLVWDEKQRFIKVNGGGR